MSQHSLVDHRPEFRASKRDLVNIVSAAWASGRLKIAGLALCRVALDQCVRPGPVHLAQFLGRCQRTGFIYMEVWRLDDPPAPTAFARRARRAFSERTQTGAHLPERWPGHHSRRHFSASGDIDDDPLVEMANRLRDALLRKRSS